VEEAFELVLGCVWEAAPEIRAHHLDPELVHFDRQSELIACVHGCILPVGGWLEVAWVGPTAPCLSRLVLAGAGFRRREGVSLGVG